MSAGLLLIAKAPVPGLAKTRLAASVGADVAARLAAAALLDTLDTGEQFAEPALRMMALTGDLSSAAHSEELGDRLTEWHVVQQRGDSFADRLVAAHEDASVRWGSTCAVVQIGTDTPQLVPADLVVLADAVSRPEEVFDAAIGPALDGGWWGLATGRAGWAEALREVPMSRTSTCRRTSQALAAAGALICHLHAHRDVDTVEDAALVAAEAPRTRFAQTWASVGMALTP